MSEPRGDGLERRDVPLEMSPEEFRRVGHRLVDAIAEFLAGLRAGPVTRDEAPSALRALLPADGVPEAGADAAALLDEAWRLVSGHSLYNGHPRFFGYITSSAAPIGALADLAAAAVNPNVGGWQLSPMASEIERQTVRWIAGMLGFPAGDGLLASGGNMANFVGFLAARRAKGGSELRARGVGTGQPLACYVARETHTWIQKAADLFGLGTDAIRWIDVDRDLRIDVGALCRRIEADRRDGVRPFLVVGNAGTVSTGAVDPLSKLADVAREHDLWFHVDGAYGAFARVVPELASAFDGLERADSLAVDPHKWLYAPVEAGCALVRDPAALRDAFAYTPEYYRFTGEDEERVNFYERGMQNSRGFRALKVWLGLRQAGLAGYRRMIGDDVRLARELYRAVEAEPELEAVTCGLSIATFRWVPARAAHGDEAAERRLDELNERLLARIKAGGHAFLSNAVVGGRFVLRACVCNFRTTLEDVRAVPGIVLRTARELDLG